MGLLALFFDVTSKKLVRGISDTAEFPIPDQHQEDSPTIDLKVLKRTSWLADGIPVPPYEVVSLTGYSLQISIGSANLILASQNTWDLNGEGNMLSAALPLNTAGINALVPSPSPQTFEVRLMDPSGNYYRVTKDVRIIKSVALAATLSLPATGTPLSVEEGNARYVAKGEIYSLTLVSEDGSKRMRIYLHNDGSKREEMIT